MPTIREEEEGSDKEGLPDMTMMDKLGAALADKM
jgi:hypothetical protein